MFSWCWTAFSLIQLRSTQKVSQSTMCPTCVTCEVRWSLSTVKGQFGMAKLICWKWWYLSHWVPFCNELLQWDEQNLWPPWVHGALWLLPMDPSQWPYVPWWCSQALLDDTSNFGLLWEWRIKCTSNDWPSEWTAYCIFFTVKDHQLGIPRHFWIAIGRLKR